METSRKTWNDERKKKMIIKFGGGGIGAVILLGGALATAALASALAVRAGRSSSKDRGRNPPPEKTKLSDGDDEAKERQEIVFCDDHTSEEAKKEVESGNGTEGFLICTRSSTLDEGKVEINGGKPGDFEASDEILCSKNLEKEDGFVIVNEDSPPLEEKWSLESQNQIPEDEENTFPEKVCNVEQGAEREKNGHENGEIELISCKDGIEVAENDAELVQIDEEGEEKEIMVLNMEKNELEACSSVNGEISEEKKCVEAIERAKVDFSEDGINQEAMNNVDNKEEEQEGVVQELESVVLHENMDGDETESALSSETLEIVQEDESNEEKVEKLVVYEEKCVVPELESVVEQENVDGDEREGAVSSETVEIVQEDEGNEEIRENVEKLVEDEEKCMVPELESVVEDENVDGDVREGAPSSETLEIVQEDESNEERRENVEEKLVEYEENCDEGIVPEKCEEVVSIDGATQSDQLSSLIDKKDEEVSEVAKELIISTKYVEIAKDSASEELPETLELNENDAITTQYSVSPKDDVEEKMVHYENYEAVKDVNEQTDESTKESEHKSTDEDEEEEDSVITTESSEDGETKDEIVEESSVETGDSSTESNSEAVWPAGSAKAKLVSYEVEGKILEDNQTNYHKSSVKFFTSEMSFINKYMAKRSMVIGMLLLSLSCSWYFDLSFVKLCVVFFLTMAVAEIHGY